MFHYDHNTKILERALRILRPPISMGKDKGVTVVLNKILIYFGGVDITDDVVKALKNTKR